MVQEGPASEKELSAAADFIKEAAGLVSPDFGERIGAQLTAFLRAGNEIHSQAGLTAVKHGIDTILIAVQEALDRKVEVTEALKGKDTAEAQLMRERSKAMLAFTTAHLAQQDLVEAHRRESDKDREIKTDKLTGLPNRRGFDEQVLKAQENNGKPVSADSPDKKRYYALLFADLDRFKAINDTLGHDVGDKVLQRFAELLQLNVRQEDDLKTTGGNISRFGGDEFGIMIETEATSAKDAANQFTEINKMIRERLKTAHYMHGDQAIPILMSSGLYIVKPGDTAEQIYKRADKALYVVKERPDYKIPEGQKLTDIDDDLLSKNQRYRAAVYRLRHDLKLQTLFVKKKKKKGAAPATPGTNTEPTYDQD